MPHCASAVSEQNEAGSNTTGRISPKVTGPTPSEDRQNTACVCVRKQASLIDSGIGYNGVAEVLWRRIIASRRGILGAAKTGVVLYLPSGRARAIVARANANEGQSIPAPSIASSWFDEAR